MGRSPCCEKEHTNKGAWTKEEDHRLINYIRLHGEGCWRSLPKAAGLLRCGKSCRLRWINYLRPDLKRGNFSPDEDELVIKLHSLLGNKWSLIAARLPGRTDNEIKNYWNTHIKRKLISRGLDPQTHRPLTGTAAAQFSRTASPPPVPATEIALAIPFSNIRDASNTIAEEGNCKSSITEEEVQQEQEQELGFVDLDLSIGLLSSHHHREPRRKEAEMKKKKQPETASSSSWCAVESKQRFFGYEFGAAETPLADAAAAVASRAGNKTAVCICCHLRLQGGQDSCRDCRAPHGDFYGFFRPLDE